MSKELARAIVKLAICNFGVWLCRFDEGDSEAAKEREEFMRLKYKHEGVIRRRKEQRSQDKAALRASGKDE